MDALKAASRGGIRLPGMLVTTATSGMAHTTPIFASLPIRQNANPQSTNGDGTDGKVKITTQSLSMDNRSGTPSMTSSVELWDRASWRS